MLCRECSACQKYKRTAWDSRARESATTGEEWRCIGVSEPFTLKIGDVESTYCRGYNKSIATDVVFNGRSYTAEEFDRLLHGTVVHSDGTVIRKGRDDGEKPVTDPLIEKITELDSSKTYVVQLGEDATIADAHFLEKVFQKHGINALIVSNTQIDRIFKISALEEVNNDV